MTQTAMQGRRYTVEDYMKTPDDKRYELIEGELIMTPAPKIDHQRISRRLEMRMAAFVDTNGLGEVFDAPVDVVLDEENVVQPDILYVSKDHSAIVGESNVQGAPDLIVEILSESSAYRDTIQKKMLYARHGVKEYWIVVPKERFVEVYLLRDREYSLAGTYHDDDTAESAVIPGLAISLRDVF